MDWTAGLMGLVLLTLCCAGKIAALVFSAGRVRAVGGSAGGEEGLAEGVAGRATLSRAKGEDRSEHTADGPGPTREWWCC